MHVFVHHLTLNQRIKVDIKDGQRVNELLKFLEDYFKQRSDYLDERNLALQYDGCVLNENWLLSDLGILPASTLKCFPKENIQADFYIYIRFRKEMYMYFHETDDIRNLTIFELRLKLSKLYGYPLTIFRLKLESINKELLDSYRVIDYGLRKHSRLVLETWIGWENFLNYCVDGYSRNVTKSMSSDEINRQFQAKVALYISAHYGHLDLANKMMLMGARPDKPVGEHPSRQWSQAYTDVKPEYLRCPIHEAVQSGQLKIVNLFVKNSIWILEHKDGFGLTPWRLSLHNTHIDPVKNLNQKDVARYLMTKQFGGKIKLTADFSVSYLFYYKLKRWLDRARERVLFLHGIAKSTLKKRPFHKGGLLGYKVLVDGYNNNFKEYQNSYETMRSKHKYFYYIDDVEHTRYDPSPYFKALNSLGAFQLLDNQKSATENGNHISSLRHEHKVKPPSKAKLAWRRMISKVINRNILKRNAKCLTKFGYHIVINEDTPNYQKPTYTFSSAFTSSTYTISSSSNKSKLKLLSRVQEQIAKEKEYENADQGNPWTIEHSNSTNGSSSHKIVTSPRVTTSGNKILTFRNQIESNKTSNHTNNNNKNNTLKSRSAVERPMVTISRNSNFKTVNTDKKATSSMSLQPRGKISETHSIINSPDYKDNYRNKSSKLCNNSAPIIRLNGRLINNDLVNKTVEPYLKYLDVHTLPTLATNKCFLIAKEFNNKSWLQQIYLSAKMASNDMKRRINVIT